MINPTNQHYSDPPRSVEKRQMSRLHREGILKFLDCWTSWVGINSSPPTMDPSTAVPGGRGVIKDTRCSPTTINQLLKAFSPINPHCLRVRSHQTLHSTVHSCMMRFQTIFCRIRPAWQWQLPNTQKVLKKINQKSDFIPHVHMAFWTFAHGSKKSDFTDLNRDVL